MEQPRDLATLLPGTWRVAATNFPMWLGGGRHYPHFDYRVLSDDPLTLADTVTYTDAAGRERTVVGRDRLRGDEFVWRGNGLLKVAASRWRVTGTGEDDAVVAIRFERTLFTPAGVDILVRPDADLDVRRVVALDTASFGLSPEEFASLSWLAAGAGR